jgi:hypothetical protein
MDLQSYLRTVLNRASTHTIDLTGPLPTVRPGPEVIDLTSAPESPLSQHLEIFLSLEDWEPVQPAARRASHKTLSSLGCWKVRKTNPGVLVIKDNQRLPASCAICLEDFKEGMVVRYLPCRHVYHKKCIDQWLSHNSCCPLDRRILQ